MGAQWARGSLDIEAKRLQNISGKVRKEMESDITFIAEQGAQYMQELIETRGTEFSAYRASVLGRGTPGRHDTGTMVDAVGFRVTSYPTVVNAEVGWIEDFMEYFGFQERGTQFVTAMFALMDASQEMKDQLKAAGPHIIERALSR
jgi:hypothetical protein